MGAANDGSNLNARLDDKPKATNINACPIASKSHAPCAWPLCAKYHGHIAIPAAAIARPIAQENPAAIPNSPAGTSSAARAHFDMADLIFLAAPARRATLFMLDPFASMICLPPIDLAQLVGSIDQPLVDINFFLTFTLRKKPL